MTQLNLHALRAAASEHGDTTTTAIASRTGIPYTTAHRLMHGGGSPLLSTVARFALAYGVTISDLMAAETRLDAA